jgi:formylmethanofuran dehydrogenase subunit C
MKGGTILVEGAAGIELGMRMRRGVIAVRGAVREDTCPATQADCRASSS